MKAQVSDNGEQNERVDECVSRGMSDSITGILGFRLTSCRRELKEAYVRETREEHEERVESVRGQGREWRNLVEK
jgi:hypothetical protein